MQISKAHEWTVKSAAFAISLVAAWAMGCKSIAIVAVGSLFSPFMVIVVWKLWTAVARPVVIPESPKFTTLNLDDKYEIRILSGQALNTMSDNRYYVK